MKYVKLAFACGLACVASCVFVSMGVRTFNKYKLLEYIRVDSLSRSEFMPHRINNSEEEYLKMLSDFGEENPCSDANSAYARIQMLITKEITTKYSSPCPQNVSGAQMLGLHFCGICVVSNIVAVGANKDNTRILSWIIFGLRREESISCRSGALYIESILLNEVLSDKHGGASVPVDRNLAFCTNDYIRETCALIARNIERDLHPKGLPSFLDKGEYNRLVQYHRVLAIVDASCRTNASDYVNVIANATCYLTSCDPPTAIVDEIIYGEIESLLIPDLHLHAMKQKIIIAK